MKRINIDECDFNEVDGGGSPIWEYQGKRYTGVLFCNEKGGALSYEQECQDGYEEGWFRAYHPNGNIKQEYNLHNNIVVSGTLKTWDEEGNPTNW